jgi:hypothetical protein
MEGESKAEKEKRVAACPFAVANNRDVAIEDEPSSTARFRVLSTSGSCEAIARPIDSDGTWIYLILQPRHRSYSFQKRKPRQSHHGLLCHGHRSSGNYDLHAET